MKKTIWILNHYAGNMYLSGGGRHYYMAKYLKENGYNPIVFCSNYDHFTRKNCVASDRLWVEKREPRTGIPFVFIRTREYSNNGLQRVFNMFDFYRGMMSLAKKYGAGDKWPGIIYASSVHPLTLIAGIRIAKHFSIKCISEVRDLWPESIVAYSSKWTRRSLLMKILYAGEKWIYKKSDSIIMTWPGGYDYIREQGWDEDIPESKVVHISNGVDLESYSENIQEYPYSDLIINAPNAKSFVYTGSVREVNNLALLVSTAEVLKKRGYTTARIVVYGDGNELEALRKEVQSKKLDNIFFAGRVQKQCVASILTQAYALILHNSSTTLDKYGQSQNKFFEYLAAGKPILMTYSVGHSVIRKYGCGLELYSQEPESIAEAIVRMCNFTDDEYGIYCKRAIECSKMYDYKELCNKLIDNIELLTK